jgi:hypothetical protein
MLIPLKAWFILMMILLSASAIYYRAFEQFPLPSSEDVRVRTELAERWAQKVALEVKRLPGRPVVAVARVVNDDAGILTGQLKRWIARRNVLMLNDQWYSGIGYTAGVSYEPKSTDEACKELLGANTDYIVAAEVANWTTYPEFEATLVGHVEIRDGKSGEIILQYQLSLPEFIEVIQTTPMTKDSTVVSVEKHGTNSESSRLSDSRTSTAAYSQSSLSNAPTPTLITGVSLWLAMIGGFPVLWSKHLKRLLRQKSNRLNFYMLLSWIAATAVLAGIMWLRLLPAGTAALLGALAMILSSVYFGFCCYCLEKTV